MNFMDMKSELTPLKKCQMTLSNLRVELKKVEDALGILDTEFSRLAAQARVANLPARPRTGKPFESDSFRSPFGLFPAEPKSEPKGVRSGKYQQMLSGPPTEGKAAADPKKKIRLPKVVKDFFSRPG